MKIATRGGTETQVPLVWRIAKVVSKKHLWRLGEVEVSLLTRCPNTTTP